MRFITLIPPLFFLLVACATDPAGLVGEDTATTPPGNTENQPPGNTENQPPGNTEDTPPTDTESWFTITTPSFEVPAGEERFLCYAFDLEEELMVDKWVFDSHPVVHHLLVVQTLGNEADGLSECDVLFRPTWFPIFVAGTGDTEVDAPEGAGYALPKGHRMLIQLHLLNASPDDFDDTVTLKLRRSEEKDLEPIGMMVFGTMSLALPPREASTVEDTCELSDEIEVFTVFPHMHYMGTSLVVERAAADEELQEVFRRDPYDFDEQVLEPIPLKLSSGDKVKVTCTYNNTSDDVVTFGESTKDEMCFFIAYVTGNNGRLDTCMGGGGSGSDGYAGFFPEGCGTDEPNEMGIGAACTAGGGECAESLACTHDLLGSVGPGLCITMNACDTSADCGGGGAVCCAPPEAGGMINICLPPSCQSPGCETK